MAPVSYKVGELARRTRLTVRTLHFYEEIGLLVPAERSDGGHRVYGAAEVERLQRITSMRQLGFTLEEIGDLLDGREGRPEVVIHRHLALLNHQIGLARTLVSRLERLAERLGSSEPEVEDLLLAIEDTVMFETYFTESQRKEIEQRREALGADGMQQQWQDWAAIVADARAEMARGTPPDDPRALGLARRWNTLVEAIVGGDAGVREGITRMWRDHAQTLSERHGIEPAVLAWLADARSRV